MTPAEIELHQNHLEARIDAIESELKEISQAIVNVQSSVTATLERAMEKQNDRHFKIVMTCLLILSALLLGRLDINLPGISFKTEQPSDLADHRWENGPQTENDSEGK